MYSGRVGTGIPWLLFVSSAYLAFAPAGVALHLLCIVLATRVGP